MRTWSVRGRRLAESDFPLHAGLAADGGAIQVFQFTAQGAGKEGGSRRSSKQGGGDGIGQPDMPVGIGQQDGVIRGFQKRLPAALSSAGWVPWMALRAVSEPSLARRAQGKRLTGSAFKFVADAAHGQQHLRPGRNRLQLLAQPADMDIHGAVIHIAVLAPDTRKKRLTVKDPAPMRSQESQEIKFFAGKAKRQAIFQHFAPVGIELEVVND